MSTVATLGMSDGYTDASPVLYSVQRRFSGPAAERYIVIRMMNTGTERLRSFQSADGALQYASMMLAEDIAVVERR